MLSLRVLAGYVKYLPNFEHYFCEVLNNHLAGIGGVVLHTIVCGQVAEFKFKLKF